MKEYQEIRDTSPLGLKMLNDQLRALHFRMKNVIGKDIRNKSINIGHVDDEFGTEINITDNQVIITATEAISQRVTKEEVGTEVIQNAESLGSHKWEDMVILCI